MAALRATIQRVTEDSTVDALGNVVRNVTVQYVVGQHGPFTLQIPASQFTAANARALIQPRVEEINALFPDDHSAEGA